MDVNRFISNSGIEDIQGARKRDGDDACLGTPRVSGLLAVDP